MYWKGSFENTNINKRPPPPFIRVPSVLQMHIEILISLSPTVLQIISETSEYSHRGHAIEAGLDWYPPEKQTIVTWKSKNILFSVSPVS